MLDRYTKELARRRAENRLSEYEPYEKQREFHEAGAAHRERLLMAGNQLGKTYSGAAELAIHLTGRYPDWWQGHRFDRPIDAWAGSDTSETTRDTVQTNLVGPPANEELWGTSAIPKDAIVGTSRRMGVANALDTVSVAHVSGGVSTLGFKSYDQGRQKWQGTKKDIIWLDEEPPLDVYTEALTRTNAVPDGRTMITFTPLLGMSDVVSMFLQGESPDRNVTRMTIDDARHISKERREQIIASYPEHEREARVKGIPMLGSGRIYPVSEASITCEPFSVPIHWATICALDFGWDHPTAAVKLAHDRDSDTIYVVNAYRRREATPLEHSATLKQWGDHPWAWPQDGLQRDKRSGMTLKSDYEGYGLNMLAQPARFADGGNGVEAGLMQILDRMRSNRFKVFSHLTDWWDEFRLYHRKDGLIVKERDDLMDATRYAVMMLRFAEHSIPEDDEWSADTYAAARY